MGRHDRLFKPLLQAFFGDLLRLVAPVEAASLDPARAEFLDKESFTDIPAGQRREMDLVVRIEGA